MARLTTLMLPAQTTAARASNAGCTRHRKRIAYCATNERADRSQSPFWRGTALLSSFCAGSVSEAASRNA